MSHRYEFRNLPDGKWWPLYVKTDAEADEFKEDFESVEWRSVVAPEQAAPELPLGAERSVDYLMEAISCFASEWSLVGGRFDRGGMLAQAHETKVRIRAMLEDDARKFAALAARQAKPECAMCNDSGIVGRAPDDYFDCPDQAQERLRQAEAAIVERDATALRVAQCAGEFARDSARFAAAVALEDNAEALYAAVMNHAPDGDAIRREFDDAIRALKSGAQEKAK